MITFRNGSSDSVFARWINYEGKRDKAQQQKTLIKPDMSKSIKTYFTHPFVVTNLNGDCQGIYIPQSKNNVVFIR